MKAMKLVLLAGVTAVVAAGAVLAGSVSKAELGSDNEVLTPGRGLSLDIGGKHAIGYFITQNDACHLTVVVADATGGETGLDSPGTRITVPVMPGRGLQVDASAGRSAEFFCGPGGTRMHARVFDRAPYKS